MVGLYLFLSFRLSRATIASNTDTVFLVWAFAVTCYEIVTQASTPYGRSRGNLEVVKSVIKGERLEYPDILPSDFAELFTSCMEADPKKRPRFSEIAERMEAAEGKEVVYASLSTFSDVYAGGGTGAQTELDQFRDSGFDYQ
jgi:Protein tyrosine and serine/threonine kinase